MIDGLDVPKDASAPVDRVGELLQRIASGEQAALARLYDLLSPRVFGLILHRGLDRDGGEEVLEAVFVDVWTTAWRFDPVAEAGREWVLAIAERHAAEAAGRPAGDDQPMLRRERRGAAPTADAPPADERTREEVPPLRTRSTVLTRISGTPRLPPVDAATAAQAPPGVPWTAPDSVDAEESFVEPAPTTATIQAVERRNWTRGVVGLVAAVVLLVAVGFAVATLNEYVNRPPEVAALQQIQDAPDSQTATEELTDGGAATAHWAPSVGRAVVEATGLPAIDRDRTFELWLLRDGDEIPAGTFRAGADGAATVLLKGELAPGDTIVMTVEPAGGAPEGEASGERIVEIPTD